MFLRLRKASDIAVCPKRCRVAAEVLNSRDVVILTTPTSEFANSFVTRRRQTDLSQLAGRKLGVVTGTGQTSVAARLTVEKGGTSATYVPLMKFDRVYAAPTAGEVDAGALPIDLRFTAEHR